MEIIAANSVCVHIVVIPKMSASEIVKTAIVQCSEIPTYAVGLIEAIAVKEGFTEYTVRSTSGSNHGDGFMGIMVRVVIEGDRQGHADRLCLICKMPPTDKVRRELFHTSKVFVNEIYAYDVMLPAMLKFQTEKSVPKDVGFFRFPKCYGTFADPEAGDFAIVLEDLRETGYQMWNKLDTLDYAHARLVVAELGRFHALSHALRDQRPTEFAELRLKKADFMLNMLDSDMGANTWKNMYMMAREALEPNETELRDKMRLLADTFVDRLRRCCKDDASEPFGVLCHGDFWNNNIMYRYEEGSRIPAEVCLIDWQLVQFCSPAMDLTHFLFTSTEKRLRDEHYMDMIGTYSDCVAVAMQAMGTDPHSFKPSDLQNQLQTFSQYGLILAPMYIQVLTTNSNDIPDMDEMSHKVEHARNTNTELDMDEMGMGKNPAYKKRVADVIRDYFKYGFVLE